MRRIILLSTLILSGCGIYGTDFDCGVGNGMACSSLYKVDHAVSRGEVDFQLEEATLKSSEKPKQVSKKPLSYPRNIWIAPKRDAQGNLHGEKIMQVRH